VLASRGLKIAADELRAASGWQPGIAGGVSVTASWRWAARRRPATRLPVTLSLPHVFGWRASTSHIVKVTLPCMPRCESRTLLVSARVCVCVCVCVCRDVFIYSPFSDDIPLHARKEVVDCYLVGYISAPCMPGCKSGRTSCHAEVNCPLNPRIAWKFCIKLQQRSSYRFSLHAQK
jgi:hypothetical protein